MNFPAFHATRTGHITQKAGPSFLHSGSPSQHEALKPQCGQSHLCRIGSNDFSQASQVIIYAV